MDQDQYMAIYQHVTVDAAKLAYYCCLRGIKQVEIARRLGICRSYVSHMKRGRKAMPLHLFHGITDILGVPPSYLLPSPPASAEAQQGADSLRG